MQSDKGSVSFTGSNELPAVWCSSKLSSVELSTQYAHTHIRTHAHTYTHCWWHQIWTITVPEILWESISKWRQAKLRWDWCQTLLRVDLWHGNNKWHKCKMFLENSLIINYIDQLHSSKNFHINSCRWKNLCDIRLFFALVEKCLMWKLCNSTPILYICIYYTLYICVCATYNTDNTDNWNSWCDKMENVAQLCKRRLPACHTALALGIFAISYLNCHIKVFI